MPGLSEIQGQNEEISGDIFPNTWNCQILFYHNLRDSSEVANLGYKKRNAVERFFSWIEAFKKIVPRYERYEHSFMGLIHLACSVMIARVVG